MKRKMVQWRIIRAVCVLAMLGALAGSAGEEPLRRISMCAERDKAMANVIPVISAEEMAAMTEEHKRITKELIDDIPGYVALLGRFCDLSDANSLPGIGSIDTLKGGDFWMARARREGRRSVLNEIAPATAERACGQLWFLVVERSGRNKIQYFFCDTGSGFALISGYEARGESWVKLE